eukprot:5467288-Alexandrium_andersonii.AAC.1
MGWSWALWVCHEVLCDAMLSAAEEGDAWCLDKGRSPSLLKHAVVRAPYVDNGNLVSLSKARVDERLDRLTTELDRRGLRWHEREAGRPDLEVLGLQLDGRSGRLRHTPRRAWRLHMALHEALRRRFLARWQLRRAVGHLVHYFSVTRPALAVLGACYRFLEAGPDEERCLLPESVRGELAVAAGLCFLGECDLQKPPSSV